MAEDEASGRQSSRRHGVPEGPTDAAPVYGQRRDSVLTEDRPTDRVAVVPPGSLMSDGRAASHGAPDRGAPVYWTPDHGMPDHGMPGYGVPDQQARGIDPAIEHDPVVEQHARRRRDAEAASAAAESEAAAAAERAATAIAGAARAAEEAEAAAEAAGRAAADAAAAAEAEERAAAEAATRHPTPLPRSTGEHGPLQDSGLQDSGLQDTGLQDTGRHDAAAQDTALTAAPLLAASQPEMAELHSPYPRTARAERPYEAAISSADTVQVPAGRAARRHAVEAAEADTTVIPIDGIAAEQVVPAAAEVPAPATEVPTRSRRADRKKKRRFARPLLVIGAVVVVLAAAAGVATVAGVDLIPSQASVVEVAAPAPAPAGAPPAGAEGAGAEGAQEPASDTRVADPKSPEAKAFLAAMRDADIQTSRSGLAETEAAVVICEQFDRGTDETTIARSVPAVLPTVTDKQAVDVVNFAQKFYC